MATILYNKINVGSSALKGLRIGSSEVKYSKIGSSLVYDTLSSTVYDTPAVSLTYPTTSTAAAGGTVSLSSMSYSQAWRKVGYSGTNYEQTKITSGAEVAYTISGTGATIDSTTGKVTWSNNASSSERTATVTVTVKLNGKTSTATATLKQARGTYNYAAWVVSISASTTTVAATGGSSTITASASRTYGWNNTTSGVGTQTGTIKLSIPTTTGASLSGTASGSTLTWANNTTTSTRSVVVTATCQEDTTKTKTVTITQSKGQMVYSDVYATLEYTNKAAAAGGTCTPQLTYGQTYTWNGVSGSGSSVATSSLTVGSYSLATTTDASIASGTGVVTWANNKSTDARTSGTVSVTITGLGSKSKTATATCMQLPGSQVWGNPSITTFSYGTFSAAGETKNPSLVYTQPYTWNGVSGSGGSVTGNGDDEFSTYSISTSPVPTGMSINTASGAVTWAANKGTTGKLDATTRTGNVTVTVKRNDKTATKTATTTQNGEAISSTSYGAWTFSITPNTTSIPATGGSVTFTLSRPSRTNTVTLTSGDSYTTTETATSGEFELTRSHSLFVLSTTGLKMSSSSLPTFTLSVAGTGAATASAISSTVTAAFTATSPTTGTTTASKTSSTVTRAASTLTSTAYKISTFSLNSTQWPASGGTATLTFVVQEQKTYTGGTGIWTAITPLSSVLKLTAGTGGSIGTITYGTTSTCTITVSPNQSTLSRTITITGTYGTAENSVTITQDQDTISSSTSAISISASSTLLPASGGTSTITCSGTTTNTWVSGRKTTSSFSPTLAISKDEGFALSGTTSGSKVTAANRTYIEGPLRGCTVTASYSGVTSKQVYIEQEKNTIKSLDISLSSTTDIPASGGSKIATCAVIFSSGSQVTNVSYFTPTWSVSGFADIGDTTDNMCTIDTPTLGAHVYDRSAIVVTCSVGSVTNSKTYYQAANKVESTAVDSQGVNTLTASSTSIAKEGGSVTITTTGTTVYKDTYTSTATTTRSVATTPTLSIPSGSTGWTLSGTTLTAAENTESKRSVVVTATLGSSSKTLTISQEGEAAGPYTFMELISAQYPGYYLFRYSDGLFYDVTTFLQLGTDYYSDFIPVLWVCQPALATYIFGVFCSYFVEDVWGTYNVDTALGNHAYGSAYNTVFKGDSITMAETVFLNDISDASAIMSAWTLGENVDYEINAVHEIAAVKGFLPTAKEIEWVCTNIGDMIDDLRGIFSADTYTGTYQWTCLENSSIYALMCSPASVDTVKKSEYAQITPYFYLYSLA